MKRKDKTLANGEIIRGMEQELPPSAPALLWGKLKLMEAQD